MVSIWTSNIDKCDLTGSVLLDLCKAFDLVDYNLLVYRLSMYIISDRPLKRFKFYLTDRQQVVKFKTVSGPLQLVSGVLKGSILPSLLFIIFINDMALETEETKLDMYADDSTLIATGKSIETLDDKLNSDMESIVAWCDDNIMAVNTDKTKAMLITTYQHFHKLPVKQLQIYINDQELHNVRVEKLLRVNIDQNMSWKPHTN